MSSALLWLACGEMQQGVDSDSTPVRVEFKVLQATTEGRWSFPNPLATPRGGHSATLLSSGTVLVIGGDGTDGSLAGAEVYAPGLERWRPTGSLAMSRHKHTSTLLPSGQVLVTGGYGPSGSLASAELYTPGAGEWSPTGSLGTARNEHTATPLLSGQVLVTGGYSIPASSEIYTPGTGVWHPTGAPDTARYEHTATLLPSGKVLVTGGGGPNGLLASTEIYNPDTGEWSSTGSLATARSGHTAVLLPSGMVLVSGGFGATGSLATAEIYDPDTQEWSSTSSLTMARSGHTATLLPSGMVLVTGGFGPQGLLASTEVYNPDTQEWSSTGSLASGRNGHTATLLPSGMVLVSGGFGPAGSLATVEVYDESGASSRPFVQPIAPQRRGASLVVQGTGFMGTNGAPGIVRLRTAPAGGFKDFPAREFSNTSLEVTMHGVPEGDHLLFVVVDGLAGGQVLQVDGTLPAAPEVNAPRTSISTHMPAIGGMAEADSTVTVWLNGKEAGTAQVDKIGAWSFTPDTALPVGPHVIKATATDVAGNISLFSAEHHFVIQRSHYGWSCASSPALPAAWALLTLALALHGRRRRVP